MAAVCSRKHKKTDDQKPIHSVEMSKLLRPSEYEKAHFFPATYGTLAALSPRACWVQVVEDVTEEVFRSCVEEVQGGAVQQIARKQFGSLVDVFFAEFDGIVVCSTKLMK